MTGTFRGGIHPPTMKQATQNKATVVLSAPPRLYVPLLQHIGAPLSAAVEKGQRVLMGQVIGQSDAPLSSPVHAPVSGTVASVELYLHPNGSRVPTVIIENDGLDEVHPSVQPCPIAEADMTLPQLAELMRRAGITGLGGASFPAHVKLSSAEGKARYLLINGAECEPYITCNHRLMLERPEAVLGGIRLLKQALGLTEALVGIESNKLNAVTSLNRAGAEAMGIHCRLLKTKYPQGGERQLVRALTGLHVPDRRLPIDVGCVVFNVETCASVYDAYVTGMPLIERCVTVSGDAVNAPGNFRVRLGTLISHVAEVCGGLSDPPQTVLMGGPMMGTPLFDTSVAVIKNTSALLFFKQAKATYPEDGVCLHCGKCAGVCPSRLLPNYLVGFVRSRDWQEAEKHRLLSCMECGSCAYTCPAGIPLVQYMRLGKDMINQEKRRRKQG